MEFGEISWVNTGVKSSSVHIPITQLDCEQFIIYPLLGSEKVGPAELKKREPINKTGGNWGEEGRLYPFSNLFPYPAPSTFRVPFTFGISPLSESLEQIQTRGWGEVLNLVWERSFFPKPTDNFDRFSYFVRCKYRYISSIKNVFILFLSSPIPPPSQNSVGWPSYFTANGYQHAWVFRWFRWFRWKLGKFD